MNKLKIAIENSGLTAAEIISNAGVSKSMFYDLIRSDELPTKARLDTVEAICTSIGIPVSSVTSSQSDFKCFDFFDLDTIFMESESLGKVTTKFHIFSSGPNTRVKKLWYSMRVTTTGKSPLKSTSFNVEVLNDLDWVIAKRLCSGIAELDYSKTLNNDLGVVFSFSTDYLLSRVTKTLESSNDFLHAYNKKAAFQSLDVKLPTFSKDIDINDESMITYRTGQEAQFGLGNSNMNILFKHFRNRFPEEEETNGELNESIILLDFLNKVKRGKDL